MSTPSEEATLSSSQFSGAHNLSTRGGQFSTAGRDINIHYHGSAQQVDSSTSTPQSIGADTNITPDRINAQNPSLYQRIRSLGVPRLFRSRAPRDFDIGILDILLADYEALLDRSSPSASLTPNDSESYARLMFKHRHGYPIYCPTPQQNLPVEYQEKGIRVGDVGRITPDGAFDFLFNVDSSLAETINPPHLPQDFETVPPIRILPIDRFHARTHLLSDHVTQTRNAPITYKCSASEGAVLQLPEGAILFEAQNLNDLEGLATRHAYNWYEYMAMTRSRNIPNGSLYLVTGCIKTNKWGIGAFNGGPDDNNYLEFICQGQPQEQTYEWRILGPIVARVGPTSTDVVTNSGQEPNQCVFIRGYKITLGGRLWKNMKKKTTLVLSGTGSAMTFSSTIYLTGSANPEASSHQSSGAPSNPGMDPRYGDHFPVVESRRQLRFRAVSDDLMTPEHDTDHDSPTFDSSEEVQLEECFSVTSPMHPSDLINAMLLRQEPEAEVAVVHDNEWCSLLPENFAVSPWSPEMRSFLENVAQSRLVAVNEYGCVSLVKSYYLKPTVVEAEGAPYRLAGTDEVEDIISHDVGTEDSIGSAGSDIPQSLKAEGYILAPGSLPSKSKGETDNDIRQVSAKTWDKLAKLYPHANTLDSGPLVPTTIDLAKLCSRFRILLVGRSGVGKSSLINSVFKISGGHRAGAATINEEITSPYNDHLVFHDSEGYEPGDFHKFQVIKNFIVARSKEANFSERLHAIWLCITTPFGNGRVLEKGDEEIYKLRRPGVPVIIVFTKYDLLLSMAKREVMGKGLAGSADVLLNKSQDLARRKFEALCITPLANLAKQGPGNIPYICASTRDGDSLEKLVQITLKNISTLKHSKQTKPLLKRLREDILKKKNISISDEGRAVSPIGDYDDPRTLTLAIAQRVDLGSKLAASISIGRKKYWNGLASGFHFHNNTIWRCLQVIHTDIVNVWNIRDTSGYLLSEAFRGRMTIIVGDLSPDEPGQAWTTRSPADLLARVKDTAVSAGPAAVVIPPIAATVAMATWADDIYKQTPHIIRCFMGFIVDLTIIIQSLFKQSAQVSDGSIDMAHVEEVVNKFEKSAKADIHAEIRAFVKDLKTRFERDSVVEKISSLIYSNEDIQL